MKFAASAAACLALIVLAGCSSVGLSGSGSPDTANAAPAGAPITDSIPSNGRVISDINIELCQATANDAPHTVDEALHDLKLSAAAKGATGVANVTSGLVTTPTPKCFTMAQAMGIAYVAG
jgi:hypothetical protein